MVSCFLSNCNKRKHIFVEFFPNITPAKFSLKWLQRRFIFYLTNKKLELPLGAMFSYQGIFVDDLSYIIPAKLGSNWPSSFREKIFFVFDKSEIGMASAAMLLYWLQLTKRLQTRRSKCELLMIDDDMTFGGQVS